MRTWCSEEYIGLTLTSDFQVQIWVQTFLLYFKILWEHEEYQALHTLHCLGLTISCRSPIPTFVFMIILSLELTKSTLWMPQAQKWFLCVTYVGRSQESQTHHTWTYHKPANHNCLMKTQLIRELLEKQNSSSASQEICQILQNPKVNYCAYVAWLKTEAIFITFHHSFVWD